MLVLSFVSICCVYGDTIRAEVVPLRLVFRVDVLCIWRHHPSGGGAVVSAVCAVFHATQHKQFYQYFVF